MCGVVIVYKRPRLGAPRRPAPPPPPPGPTPPGGGGPPPPPPYRRVPAPVLPAACAPHRRRPRPPNPGARHGTLDPAQAPADGNPPRSRARAARYEPGHPVRHAGDQMPVFSFVRHRGLTNETPG
nr:MAG: hypothetical protein DIU60_22280 [Actinomycetota bacterium]